MENKEHIKNTIQYLKDDRPTPEYDAKKKYLEELEYLQPRTVKKIFTVKIKLNHNTNRPLSESENWLKKTLRDKGYQVID